MCLLIDRRESLRPAGKELLAALRRYDIELSTDLTLEYGDAMFAGNGESGECFVGVEHKRLGDLITSMKDRRLSGHQLRGLWKAYDYVFLFAEGIWRPGPGGEIEELGTSGWKTFFSARDKYAVSYRQLAAYLHSLSLRSKHPQTGEPLRVVRTQNPRETAAQYAALYLGFTEKTWREHHAHDEIYTEITQPKRMGLVQKKVTTAWKMAAQIPKIDRIAEQVAEHFGTVRAMALAGLSERMMALVERYFAEHPDAAAKAWRAVDGIGRERAEAAVRAFTERD